MIIKYLAYESDGLQEQAAILAQKLNLILEKDACPALFLTQERLTLKFPNFSLLSADFSEAACSKKGPSWRKQGLIKACKPNKNIRILDTTAGWGKDAAILSGCGAKVLMLERNNLMAALISDALVRQNEQDKKNLQLDFVETDARTYINQLQPLQYPDVIYIDPMHPERTKTALVKKEMQTLQQMIGADEDALQLIQCALSRAKQRVVVKWPQRQKPLLKPSSSIEGKTVRFDIYC